MFGLGPTELIFILVIALLIFGPRKLPEVGQQLGRALREFKKGAQALKEEVSVAVDAEGLKEVKGEVTSTTDSLGLKGIHEEIRSATRLPDLKSELGGIQKEITSATDIKPGIEAAVGMKGQAPSKGDAPETAAKGNA